MARDALQPGYVLHSRRFRDSSLIVDFMSRHDGRITVMARGALAGKRGYQGLLQPFVPLLIAASGRGEMLTLNALEAAGSVPQFVGTNLFCGLYVNELLLKLTVRHDPNPPLFDIFGQTLEALRTSSDVEPVLRRFEVHLLDLLGLAMPLHTDTEQQDVEADRLYQYDIELGPVPIERSSGECYPGKTLLALANGELGDDRQTRQQARQLMRRVIAYHLNGQELKSRELFA